MANAINWFEIPTADINRAIDFYSQVFDQPLQLQDLGEFKMAFLPVASADDLSGAIVQHEQYVPSATHGPLIYLNGGDDLSDMLSRVEQAGGKVLLTKTQISPEHGFVATFIDSEGNRMALHSPA